MNSIAVEAFATMESRLAEATTELFASYGIVVTRVASVRGSAPPSAERSIVAIIGYAGENVRGALVMFASRAAIESWIHAIEGIDEKTDPCDAIGEFSNMLLGRLKGHLLHEGFPILLSTPTTAYGGGLRLSSVARPSSWLAFDGPGWRLDVRIDAMFDDGFTLQANEDRQAPAEAGEMMLF